MNEKINVHVRGKLECLYQWQVWCKFTGHTNKCDLFYDSLICSGGWFLVANSKIEFDQLTK